ncbi:MAG: hypothetical protein ACTSRG_21530 [Candidatus Helarchaeota archaeon]
MSEIKSAKKSYLSKYKIQYSITFYPTKMFWCGIFQTRGESDTRFWRRKGEDLRGIPTWY